MAESLLAELSLRDRARQRVLPDELSVEDIMDLCFPTYNERNDMPKQERQDYANRIRKFKQCLNKSIEENAIQTRHEEVKIPARNFRGTYSSAHTDICHYISCDHFLTWLQETKLWAILDKDALIWGWWKDDNYPNDFEKPTSIKPTRANGKKEDNTLKALGCLSVIIAKMATGYKKGDASPNASAIMKAVIDEAERLKVDTHGLNTGLRGKIAAGVKLSLEEVPADKKEVAGGESERLGVDAPGLSPDVLGKIAAGVKLFLDEVPTDMKNKIFK